MNDTDGLDGAVYGERLNRDRENTDTRIRLLTAHASRK